MPAADGLDGQWPTTGAQPTSPRRAALAKEYMETTQGLLTTLDKLSGVLAASVNHQDATIDQLFAQRAATYKAMGLQVGPGGVVSTGTEADDMSPQVSTSTSTLTMCPARARAAATAACIDAAITR